MTWGVRLAAAWLLLFIVCALAAEWIPYVKDPAFLYGFFSDSPRSGGPSARHWLGTDASSRDNLARLVHGARVPFIVGVTSVAIGLGVGGMLGSIAGFVRGRVDAAIMACLDVALAFPPLVLVVVTITVTRERSLPLLAALLGLTTVPGFARVARANALVVSTREFVDAARAVGARPWSILRREVIPNVMASLVAYSFSVAAVVIALEASLAFIGFGAATRLPSWGRMVLLARVDIRLTIWPLVYPSVVLVATILSLNVVGDWWQRRSEIRPSSFG